MLLEETDITRFPDNIWNLREGGDYLLRMSGKIHYESARIVYTIYMTIVYISHAQTKYTYVYIVKHFKFEFCG